MYQNYHLQQGHLQQQDGRRNAQQQQQQQLNSVPQHQYAGGYAPSPVTYHPERQPSHPSQPWQQLGTQDQFYTAQTSPQTATHPQAFATSPVYNVQYHQSWPQHMAGSFPQHTPLNPGYNYDSYSNAAYAQHQSMNYSPYNQNLQSSSIHPSYTARDSGTSRLSYTNSQPSNMLPESKSLLTPSTVVNAAPSAQSRKQAVMLKPAKLTAVDQDEIVVKRRKSNDGSVIREHPVSTGIKQNTKKAERKVPALQTSHEKDDKDDTINAFVLVALGEEYTAAAHDLAPSVCSSDQIQEYQKLISTAIACYDSALKNFRHNDARFEARLRLKLATLIFEETAEHTIAAEILSKGITTCERAALPDMKYTLQYQLLRVMYEQGNAVATKAVDRTITEVETLQLQHWVIAFRLLKFANSAGTGGNIAGAIRNLAVITDIAHKTGAIMLAILTSCLETLLQLRSGTTAALTLAQQSLASAMQYQLRPEMQEQPQLRALISALSMACQIVEFKADSMQTALQLMSQEQDACSRAKGWRDNGMLTVLLNHKVADNFFGDTAGIFVNIEGRPALTIDWLSKAGMLTMGYMISGIALLPRNGDNRKSETFFKEALKINSARIASVPGSIHHIETLRSQHQAVDIGLRLTIAATYAARSDYKNAVDVLQELRIELQQHKISLSEADISRLKFLTACCLQGQGELDKALTLYRQWLRRPFDADDTSISMARDFHCLAILNSIHILRVLPDDHIIPEQAKESIKEYCLAHPNKSFTSAYYVLESTTNVDAGIVTFKKSLNQALTPAQANKNKQMLALIMNRMSEMFFTDIVGLQAVKSANAARTLARQAGDNLWTAVGCGMLRDTLEKSGQLEEALEANRNARDAVAALPPKVRSTLQLG